MRFRWREAFLQRLGWEHASSEDYDRATAGRVGPRVGSPIRASFTEARILSNPGDRACRDLQVLENPINSYRPISCRGDNACHRAAPAIDMPTPRACSVVPKRNSGISGRRMEADKSMLHGKYPALRTPHGVGQGYDTLYTGGSATGKKQKHIILTRGSVIARSNRMRACGVVQIA